MSKMGDKRLLNYKNLSESTKNEYYLLHKLSLIKYDLISCIKIIDANRILKDPMIIQYSTKMLCVHINEAIGYLRENLALYDKYIDSNIKDSDGYSSIVNEMDYANNKSYNNLFIWSYRCNSVHYKDDKKFQYIDEFYKYASEFSCYLPEIEIHFPDENNVEMKSMIVNQNMFIIDKDITPEQFANIIIGDIFENLFLVLDNMAGNLLKKLEG